MKSENNQINLLDELIVDCFGIISLTLDADVDKDNPRTEITIMENKLSNAL